MNEPVVTVVVATYNRPDPLRVALVSLIHQTKQDWRAIVVGDECDGRTAGVIRSVNDSRIQYVNLPVRFGEQSGPNSIGLRLATTPFVAFLNHDDVWLSDHLELALSDLLTTGADFFVGRAAFASRPRGKSGGRPVFMRVNPDGRCAGDSFYGPVALFEPCSAWLVRSDFARRIGDWRSATSLYRTPLVDWIARGWRAGGHFIFAATVTVLKMEARVRRPGTGGYYGLSSPDHAYVEGLLAGRSASQVRREVLDEIARHAENPPIVRRHPSELPVEVLSRVLLNPLTAAAYRAFGIDAHALYSRCVGRGRGVVMQELTIRRTGRSLPPQPLVDEVFTRLQRPA